MYNIFPPNRMPPKTHLTAPTAMGYYGPYGPSHGYAEPATENKLNQYDVGAQAMYPPNFNYASRHPYYPLEMSGYNMPTALRGPSPVMIPPKFPINRVPMPFPNMRGANIDNNNYQGYYRNFPYAASEIQVQIQNIPAANPRNRTSTSSHNKRRPDASSSKPEQRTRRYNPRQHSQIDQFKLQRQRQQQRRLHISHNQIKAKISLVPIQPNLSSTATTSQKPAQQQRSSSCEHC